MVVETWRLGSNSFREGSNKKNKNQLGSYQGSVEVNIAARIPGRIPGLVRVSKLVVVRYCFMESFRGLGVYTCSGS